jgi:hypothetical protein
MHHGHWRRGPGFGFGFGRRRFPSPEEWIERLESHQRDLEEEAANVAELIRRLRAAGPEQTSSA